MPLAPEAGAQCGNSARWDLCGGPPTRAVPTATRTGNAGDKFVSLNRYVAWRLRRLLVKKRGRNLHAGQWERWTRTWFHDQGLHQLMGTIRYPKAA